ncbi:MAG: O-antigen polymerase [Chloroflexota bacterium]
MLIATSENYLRRWSDGADVRATGGYFPFWLVSLGFLLGLVTMVARHAWLLPYFVPLAYAAILVVFVRTIKSWRDAFNPLCLICAIGVVRHLLPALLLLNGVTPPEEVRLFFQAMKLSTDDWRWGHALALFGLLGASLGWLLVQQSYPKERCSLRFGLAPGVRPAAVAGMAVGFGALAVFLVSNASLDVITSGAFRETTIQEGTGKFFFLAYLLISGSVLLTCYYLPKISTWSAFLPVMAATVFYWVLGGRSRAMISLAGGLLLLWYLRRQQHGWAKITLNYPYILIAPLALIAVLWVSYLGAMYRGELGARVFSEALNFRELWQYMQVSIFTDLGQLHSLAGAIAIGPGVLGGQTFYGALSWPLNKLIFIPGRSAGVYIVETLVGFATQDSKWAVNASLIGDAYLNFGLLGTAAVMVLYGAVVKTLYLQFRRGRLHAAVYVLALIYSLLMMWASFEVWPQALTVLVFASGLIFLSETLLRVRSDGVSA